MDASTCSSYPWDGLIAKSIRGARLQLDEDLMQVGRLAVWAALPTHDPGKGRLEAFLNVVVRRRVIDHLRRQRGRAGERVFHPRDPSVIADSPVADPAATGADDLVRQIDSAERVDRIMGRCTPGERRVLEALIAAPDAPAKVIAAHLRTTEGNVWTQLSQVRSRETSNVA